MDLNVDLLPNNTAEARFGLTGVPEWTQAAWGPALRGVASKVAERVSNWATETAVDYHRTPRGLVLTGPASTGKTLLASWALRHHSNAGVGSRRLWNLMLENKRFGNDVAIPAPAHFEYWPRLVARARRERWDDDAWLRLLDERVASLVLDDVGLETGTEFRETFLLSHMEWAVYRRGRALILTLNDPPERWATRLGERVARRLSDPHRFLTVVCG